MAKKSMICVPDLLTALSVTKRNEIVITIYYIHREQCLEFVFTVISVHVLCFDIKNVVSFLLIALFYYKFKK